MRRTTKRAAFAALLMAGLMLVGAACSSSSDKSGGSSNGSESSSATTAKPEGGDSGACVDLFNKTEELSANLESSVSSPASTSSVDLSSMVSSLDSFTSTVPSAIREDWKSLVSGLKGYADAMKGVDMNNLTDPATQEKLTKAAASMDDAKFQTASDNIEAWVTTNCPSYANK
ncbi:unannotated protein [freshwater metagenome]|uniref:Unannotated protein n=1 Tax=freshwater metagenome TaxID=449393 RepID=A0A6J6P0D2_9ZZZZ|nr:hypothetical protein [Actinomycetota bacterium]